MKRQIISTDEQNTIMGEAMDSLCEELGYESANEMWDSLCGDSEAWPHGYDWFDADGKTLASGDVSIRASDECDAARIFLAMCERSLRESHTEVK